MTKNLWYLVALVTIVTLLVACSGAPAPAAPPPAEEAPAEAAAAGAEEEEAAPAEAEAEAEAAPAEEVTINVYLTAVGNEEAAYGALIEQFTAETGIEVEVVQAPESATDNLAQQLQFLGAGASDLDVYQIDVIWPGIMAEYALDLYEHIPAEEIESHFPALVENNTVEGKLVALPWYTAAGMLYYRTDLLEEYGYDGPPATWTELEAMAQTIQEGERAKGNDNFWGFVWQGNNYEGLTCDALEWQYSYGGGRIIEPDGTITINNPAALAAFEQAAGWVDTISPPGVTTYQEEDARGVWQTGNAAFMRNWPYAIALGESEDSVIKGKFGTTVLPAGEGGAGTGTLGGWQFMVSKYSQNPEAAVEFVRFIAGPVGQKYRALELSELPTITSLYSDEEILAKHPFMGTMSDVLSNAVARPSTVTSAQYNEVSAAYFNAVHTILTGEATATDALNDLEAELAELTGFEAGQP